MRLRDKKTGEIIDSIQPLIGGAGYSLAELCERFEDVPEEKKYGGRVPKKGDAYWFISSGGTIIEDTWADEPADHNVFESGSAFWTCEEAEKELKRRKAYVILKEDTKGFVPDWKDLYAHKFSVCYNHNGKTFYTDWADFSQTQPGPFFATREDAEASIKAHEQLWIDYLGIKEEE